MIIKQIIGKINREVVMGEYYLEKILEDSECKLILTIDCEGTNFDKNLENNVLNLKRFLELTTRNNVYIILFITPYFADMLYRLNLVYEIKKEYKVIFGLHIHPNNLTEEIQNLCSFAREDVDEISFYSFEQQKLMIKESIEYLRKRDVFPLQIFRGGYFSMNDDTAKALMEVSDIRWESHNIHRHQYNVTKQVIKSLPVHAFDKDLEFRLEYFNMEELLKMTRVALDKNIRIIGITHSYLLDNNDLHYGRDGIEGSIYSRLEGIIREMSLNKNL
ncbi:MAG: hypothetical protein K0R09_1673 [Clostridiales bacterium]|nr:hypothetical protein [Clostridiales bacterium]